jgi:hypothetical protein
MAVTLAEILARDVPIHWYENVAVAQQLCAKLSGLSAASGLPELQQIELLPEGGVIVTGVRQTRDTAVARIGFIMNAMLGEDVPVQLRLLISKATVPVPLYGSVDEFSKALEYFERPNRTAHIAELYRRYLASPPNISPRPVVLLTSQDTQPAREPARSNRLILAVCAAAIVIAGVAALFVTSLGNRITGIGNVASEAVVSTSADLASTIGNVADSLRERLGGEVSVTETPAQDEPPPAAKPAPQRRGPASARSSRPRAFDLEGDVAPPAAAPPAGTRSTTADASIEVPTIAAVRSAADARRGAQALPSEIYALEDADVVPPVIEREMLPTQLPAGLRKEDLAVMELIIGPDGTVERAQLHGEPRDVLDSMMLHIAKSWRFHPAERNGEAVTYRKLIWITRN